jgi:transposase
MTHSERVERRKEIADMVHAGSSIGETANYYGVSMTMVRMAHTEFYPNNRIELIIGKPRSSKTIQIVALLVKTHLTLSEIAAQVGVTYQRVQQVQAELSTEGINRYGD